MNSPRKLLLSGALAGTALVGGALIANLANAATSDGSSTSATTATTTAPSQSGSSGSTGTETPAPADRGTGTHDPSKGGHQANGKTETLLTGDTKTKAVAAAQAAVPGATVERAETDAEGAVYEVHMTKSDGSEVTVKLDASFKVTDTIDGMG